ncbi:MAG TPA: hypothetical protein VF131_27380 [Blastocatellia bacterium]|nr:hypothetical protein [Blastocatellia bacterium]
MCYKRGARPVHGERPFILTARIPRNKFPSEIDDSAEPGGGSAIRINSMVNGESIFKEDVVIWYAGHWTHDSFDISSRFVGQGPFYNGPDIIIRRW